MNRLSLLVLLTGITPLFASAQTLERVVSETVYQISLSNPSSAFVLDSISYFYSGVHGSYYDYRALCFNCRYNAPLADPDYTIIRPQPNNQDMALRPHVMADSTLQFIHPPGYAPFHYATQTISYNADSTVAAISRYVFPNETDTTVSNHLLNTWSGGRLTKVVGLIRNTYGRGLDSLPVRFINYDAAGLVRLDSTAGSHSIRYTYDAAGRYTSRRETLLTVTPAVMVTSDSNVYDAAGRLQLQFHYELNPNTQNATIYNDSFAYMTGVPGFTAQFRFYVDTATRKPNGSIAATITNSINALNLSDSITTYSGTAAAMAPVKSYRYHYNANKNPIQKDEWNETPAGHIMTHKTVYAYESYQLPPSTTLHVAEPAAVPMSVSPNPTTGLITLRRTNTHAGDILRTYIRNFTGQLIQTEELGMQNGTYQLMLSPSIPAGLYFLQVVDEQGLNLFSGKLERKL